ncbi:MAG: metal-dependent hydrolase [Moorellales bacterium]
MVGRTHAVAGAALGAAVGALGGPEAQAAAILVGALSALLPDVDHPGSKAGRWLWPVAVWLEWGFGHRDSPTHTLLFAALCGAALGLLAWPFAGAIGLAAGALGGASHLLLDALTKSGVAPFRPFSVRHFAGPFTTGGLGEWLVLLPCVLVILMAIGANA